MTLDPNVKEVVNFAERLRYVLELKINKLRIVMQKSNTPLEGDMLIQALEWAQGTIQDLVINNVTRGWPVYDDEQGDTLSNKPSGAFGVDTITM
jgi:hypothetical protein